MCCFFTSKTLNYKNSSYTYIIATDKTKLMNLIIKYLISGGHDFIKLNLFNWFGFVNCHPVLYNWDLFSNRSLERKPENLGGNYCLSNKQTSIQMITKILQKETHFVMTLPSQFVVWQEPSDDTCPMLARQERNTTCSSTAMFETSEIAIFLLWLILFGLF